MVLKCVELKSWDRSPGEIVIYPQCDPCDHCKLPVMFHRTRLLSPKKVIKEKTQLKRTFSPNYPLFKTHMSSRARRTMDFCCLIFPGDALPCLA